MLDDDFNNWQIYAIQSGREIWSRDIIGMREYGYFDADNIFIAHRENGPALHFITIGNGSAGYSIHYALNGEKFYCASQKEFEKLMRLKAFW